MKQEEKRTEMLAVFLLSIPVIYLALCAAPYIENGLLGIIEGITAGIENPKSIRICEDSPKTVLVFLAVYAAAIAVYISTKKNYRKGEEHGSAKWGNATEINKKYKQNPMEKNKILTQNVCLGRNGKKHKRN